MTLSTLLPESISFQVIEIIYLVAAVLFVLGLKGLSHPRTAIRGNQMAALAMLLAAVVTLLHKDMHD